MASVARKHGLGSTPELRGSEFPHLDPPAIFCIFRVFFFFFSSTRAD